MIRVTDRCLQGKSGSTVPAAPDYPFHLFRLFFFILPVFWLTGCGPSLSKAQVDRILLGMTVAEVEDSLGKGKSLESGEVQRLVQASVAESGAKVSIDQLDLRGIRWGDDKKHVTVIFNNGRVFRVFPQGLDK